MLFTKPISIPFKNEKLAEFVGIMLGDGSIYDGKTVKRIEIVLNKDDDYNYAKNIILPLFKGIFNKELKIRNFEWNAIGLFINSKQVVEDLKKFGLIPGNKIKHQVGIPLWIFDNIEWLKSCIRGLIDTDGCIFKRAENNRGRIEFYTSSLNLVNDFMKAMKISGIKASKRKSRGKYICGIYSWKEVKKFIDVIGFSNNKNIERAKLLNTRM